MLKNGQTYFKNLAVWTQQDFKVGLAIFQQYVRGFGVPFYKFDLHSHSPISIPLNESISYHTVIISAGSHMFKVNSRNTRTRCETCLKLTIKIPERCQWRRSGIFIVNFEHISHLVLEFLLLTLSRQMPAEMASPISSVMRLVVNHPTQQKSRYVIKWLVSYPNLNIYSIFYDL